MQNLETRHFGGRRDHRACGRAYLSLALAAVALLATSARGSQVTREVEVRIDTGEARAVLDILEKRRAGVAIDDGDWTTLFNTAGYRRLQARELSMGR